MSSAVVWVDGKISDAAEARVAALDHGLTVGDGVFETLKVVGGVPFALSRHLLRLRESAAVLGLAVPADDEALRSAAASTISAAIERGCEPGRLRITVTGGLGPLGSGRDSVPATLVIAAAHSTGWPATSAVATVEWVRNERSAIAGAKTTSYAENVVALAAAHRAGADEAVMANTTSVLCEGTGSNVFVVRDGELLTPALSTGCLAGITRALVLESTGCREVVDLSLDDLADAPEAFLTSSTRDVHPIATVDGRPLGNAPGPLTRDAMERFAALAAATFDP